MNFATSHRMMFGSRKWIRSDVTYYRASLAHPGVITVSTAELRRRLRSRPLTRVHDGRVYVITYEARRALEENGKGMLKRDALDDLAYWKRQGLRVLLVSNGGRRFLLYTEAIV